MLHQHEAGDWAALDNHWVTNCLQAATRADALEEKLAASKSPVKGMSRAASSHLDRAESGSRSNKRMSATHLSDASVHPEQLQQALTKMAADRDEQAALRAVEVEHLKYQHSEEVKVCVLRWWSADFLW